ncbi:MAG: hypothetical protein WC523_00185 [Patescibacteria group bacterium]
MQKIILCNLSDSVSVLNEERLAWINNILEDLKIAREILNLKNIDEFRNEMEMLGIEIELDTANNVNVYKKTWHNGKTPEQSGWLPAKKENLIAQWKTPSYIKKIEGNNVYYEIHLNEWSIVRKK